MQHAAIRSPHIHECKQIDSAATTDAGKVITPSSTLAGTGELRRLRLSEIDNDVGTLGTGWAMYFRSGTLELSAGVPAQVELSNLSPDFSFLPAGGALWDFEEQALIIQVSGSIIDVAVQIQYAGLSSAANVQLSFEPEHPNVIALPTTLTLPASSSPTRVHGALRIHVGSGAGGSLAPLYMLADTDVTLSEVRAIPSVLTS